MIILIKEAKRLRFILALLVISCLAGCEKRSGQAVVLSKEHIAAAPITEREAMPSEPDATPADEETPRPIADDEIAVDSYVMKKEVRGTSRDPRALKEEQWLVKVRVISDGRIFNVPAEQVQFDKLKEGDRVQVDYRVGKYTGTVWGAEISDMGK